MTDLPGPNDVKIVTKTTKTMTFDLTEDQVESIVLDWAKGRGFSHRATIDTDVSSGGMFRGMTITETIIS